MKHRNAKNMTKMENLLDEFYSDKKLKQRANCLKTDKADCL